MMHIHFIAIGGAAMHNLAIALHDKGYKVTGSDDEIFNPSKARLLKHSLLPEKFGWFPEKINADIDVIILGMHARIDNPELLRAQELNLKVFSYPEYLYEQCKDKKRVVIGGSHGKTTITAMVMHVLKTLNYDFDYMVGAQLEGFETMVKLSHEAPIAIFEGDEYLSSPIDSRPKFHWYKPDIALLTGVAWDHINVFPTWDIYVEQFKIFAHSIKNNGSLIWYAGDDVLKEIQMNLPNGVSSLSYDNLNAEIINGETSLTHKGHTYKLCIFGKHNLQNLNGARLVCAKLGIDTTDFFNAITSFKGAAKRLQLLNKNNKTAIYLDFAHSPSKLKATTEAVKKQFKDRELIACMELHTFSSLSKDFLPEYKNTMRFADKALVYFNPEVIKHKQLENITKEEVQLSFGSDNVTVYTDTELLQTELQKINWENKNLLFMSSGNFSGIDFHLFAKELI